MKVNRFGQASIFKKDTYLKIRKNLLTDSHKLFSDLAWFTAERPSAILQLKVDDVYIDPTLRKVRNCVIYRGAIRKTNDTRECPVSTELTARLRAFDPTSSKWLFPSLIKADSHLSLRAMDRAFRRSLARCALEQEGYSLYSFRRSALTTLRNAGYDIRAIQAFSGHKSLSSLARYLDIPTSELNSMTEFL